MVRDLARARDRETPSDAELAARAAAGDVGAFDELYRRHAQSAWRVAQAVAGNAEDAADAVADAFVQIFQALPAGRLTHGVPFRPYLLKATRNAAIDSLRRGQRVRPTGELDVLDATSTAATPPEKVVVDEEVSLVADAFRDLPERWRSVLWLTEVEGMPARDASTVLGMSANAVAQLALRARAGLRRNYLQAHVRNGVSPECRATVDHLGAYVGGALARRDVTKVERHLETCAQCQARLKDLKDLGSTLRRGVVALPVALGATVAGRTAKAAAASAARRTVSSVAHRAVAAATAGVLALGVVGLVLGPRTADRGGHPQADRSPVSTAAPEAIALTAAAHTDPLAATAPAPAGPATGEPASTPSLARAAIPAQPPGRVPPPTDGGGPGPSPPPRSGQPPLEVTASGVLGVADLGIAAGGCTAITTDRSAGGCIADPRTTPGVTLAVSAAHLPRVEVPIL